LDAQEVIRAIRDGEVDAFVLRNEDSYRVETLEGASTPYRVLVESMNEGAVTVARDGTVLFANARVIKMLERPAAAVIGQSITDWLELPADVLGSLLQSASRGEARHEATLRARDQTIPVMISACALPNDAAPPVYCLVISDMSDRKVAETSRARAALLMQEREELDAIFSRLPFAVFVIGKGGDVSYMNANGALLVSSGEIIDEVRGYAAQVLAGEPVEAREAMPAHPTRSSKHFRIHANTLQLPGQPPRAVVVLEDITSSRREERQRERNEQFREISMAILGHDLRTPLGTVLSAASLLKQRARTSDEAKMPEMILRASQRMLRLIDDMLDVTQSRLGSGIRILPAPVELADIVATAISEIEGAKPSRRFEIEAMGNTRGNWDAGRLAQVMTNLLTNAVQHGAPSGAVRIRLEGRAEQHVVISVTNQGPSIPSELLPVIFDPFRRGSSADANRSRGVGLGLYITEQIVVAHRGTVTVSSSPEEGTTFTVTLPRTTEL